MKNIFFLLIAFFVLVSCKKDNDDPQIEPDVVPEETASLKMMVEFVYGDETFHLDSNYVTWSEDTVRASVLQFFLSNIELSGDNDVEYSEPSSYHLLTKENGSLMSGFQVDDIPAGDYHMLHFGLGVDSEANTSIAHVNEGDLDATISQGMLWSWDTGYKFLKLEGASGSKEGVAGVFTYHVGKDENYKSIMKHQPMTFEGDKSYMVHFQLDVEKLFDNIDVVEAPAAHGTGSATFMTNLESALILHHFQEIDADL